MGALNIREQVSRARAFVTGAGLGPFLVRAASGSAALAAGRRVFALAATILLSRALGAQGYGYYAFAIATIAFIAIPAQLGLPQLVTREIAAMHVRSEWGLLRGLRRRVWQVSNGSIFLGIAVAVGLLLLSAKIPALEPATFSIALLLLPLQIYAGAVGGILRGLRRVLQAMWPTTFLGPAVFLALLAILWPVLTEENAAAAVVASTAVSVAVLVLQLRRYWPPQTAKVQPTYRTRQWLSSLLPFTLLASVNVLNTKVDVLMLGTLASASAVGLYSVAIQGAMLVSFPLTTCGVVLAPEIARLHAQGRRSDLQKLLTKSTILIVLPSGAAALALALGGRWILSTVFGTTFEEAYAALAILALGQFVNSAAGPIGLFLAMTGHEKNALSALVASAILNLALNALLIPPFGIIGSAVATATSLVACNILLALSVFKRLYLIAGPFGNAFHRNIALERHSPAHISNLEEGS